MGRTASSAQTRGLFPPHYCASRIPCPQLSVCAAAPTCPIQPPSCARGYRKQKRGIPAMQFYKSREIKYRPINAPTCVFFDGFSILGFGWLEQQQCIRSRAVATDGSNGFGSKSSARAPKATDELQIMASNQFPFFCQLFPTTRTEKHNMFFGIISYVRILCVGYSFDWPTKCRHFWSLRIPTMQSFTRYDTG